MHDCLLVRHDGAIAEFIFNRPQRLNASDAALATCFEQEVNALLDERHARVLVLSGAGRAFMAGGDLAAFRDASPDARGELAERTIAPYHRALLALAASDVLTVASVHGAAAGAGLSLCLGTDLAIAAEGTRFSFAYTRVAASPDCGGSFSLPRLVGLRKALELALLDDSIDAATALQLGIVNRVVPEIDRPAATRALAERLAAGPRTSLGVTKRLMRESLSRDFAAQLDAERRHFVALAARPDFQEGLDAFHDKRPARFTD